MSTAERHPHDVAESAPGADAPAAPAHRPLRLLVLSAGASTPSSTRGLADGLARETRAALSARGRDVEVRTVELRDLAHDTLDLMLTRFPSERLGEVLDALRSADGAVVATPIYTIGPSALLSAFLQATDPSLWTGRPVLLAATGGTARHSLALDYAVRPQLAHLKARLTATTVFAATADLGSDGQGMEDSEPLSVRIRRAGEELAAMMCARSAAPGTAPDSHGAGAPAREQSDRPERSAPRGDAREAGAPRDPEFEDFVPMDQLLKPRGPHR